MHLAHTFAKLNDKTTENLLNENNFNKRKQNGDIKEYEKHTKNMSLTSCPKEKSSSSSFD